MKNRKSVQARLRVSLGILILFITALTATAGKVEIVPIRLFQADAAFYGTPLVTQNFIVIGSHDKNIYFFNHQGVLVKKCETEGFVHATATELSDGKIAIGSYDKHLYIFSKEGDLLNRIKLKGRIFTNVVENKDGELVFGCNNSVIFLNYSNKNVFKIRTRNLIHGSIQLLSTGNFAIGSNDKEMFFINSAGDIIKKYKTNGWILHSKPVELSNGLIVFGSYDHYLHFTTKEGEPVGKIQIGGKIHSTPLETIAGQIICTAYDGTVYFLSKTGKIVREFMTGGKIIASPAEMPDGTIVIGSYDKNLYLINPDGKELAKYKTGGKIFSSPKVVNDSTIVCATTNGKVYFLGINKSTNDFNCSVSPGMNSQSRPESL